MIPALPQHHVTFLYTLNLENVLFNIIFTIIKLFYYSFIFLLTNTLLMHHGIRKFDVFTVNICTLIRRSEQLEDRCLAHGQLPVHTPSRS